MRCYVCSLACTISYVHRGASNSVLHAQNLVYKKIIIYEGLIVPSYLNET